MEKTKIYFLNATTRYPKLSTGSIMFRLDKTFAEHNYFHKPFSFLCSTTMIYSKPSMGPYCARNDQLTHCRNSPFPDRHTWTVGSDLPPLPPSVSPRWSSAGGPCPRSAGNQCSARRTCGTSRVRLTPSPASDSSPSRWSEPPASADWCCHLAANTVVAWDRGRKKNRLCIAMIAYND